LKKTKLRSIALEGPKLSCCLCCFDAAGPGSNESLCCIETTYYTFYKLGLIEAHANSGRWALPMGSACSNSAKACMTVTCVSCVCYPWCSCCLACHLRNRALATTGGTYECFQGALSNRGGGGKPGGVRAGWCKGSLCGQCGESCCCPMMSLATTRLHLMDT
jgi:hypothetical protein